MPFGIRVNTLFSYLPVGFLSITVPHSKYQMAVMGEAASPAAVDTISPVGDHPAKHSASDADIRLPSHTNEEEPEITEGLHLDEGDVNVRTKIRTLAIVSALYFVLFIAALDQTIIA